MTTQTLIAGTPEADLEAARLERDGKSVSQIAARFDPMLSPGAVKAAIARGRHQLNQQAPKPSPLVRPAPQASPSASEPAPVPDPVEQLLAWAESAGAARAAGLAVRIRRQLTELTALREQHVRTEEARRSVSALEKQLAAAKAQLRQLTTVKPRQPEAAQAPQPGSKEERTLIRAWAREQGYPVGDVGVIGKQIVEEYRAAHAGSGAD
jgi:small-conductance mechanosensitive channel